MTAKSPARLVRWVLRLSEFEFEIVYKRGKENVNADALSRLPLGSSTNILEDIETEGMVCSICDCLNSIAIANKINIQ